MLLLFKSHSILYWNCLIASCHLQSIDGSINNRFEKYECFGKGTHLLWRLHQSFVHEIMVRTLLHLLSDFSEMSAFDLLAENEVQAYWERSLNSSLCWSQISNWHWNSWPSRYWYAVLSVKFSFSIDPNLVNGFTCDENETPVPFSWSISK